MALMSFEAALAHILDGAGPLCEPPEAAPLNAALGRILARDVVAGRDQPPFASSAMDGYALGPAEAACWTVVGEASAGRAFRREVKAGEAVRIFTGAPVPRGCDRILIQENSVRENERLRADAVPPPGAHIRSAGLDFRAGETLLHAGRKLTPRDLMLAAGANLPALAVAAKPVIAILATGDELVAPGALPRDDQIVASGSTGVAAMVARSGGAPLDLGVARDDPADLDKKIAAARGAHVLVTIGGASVGDYDLVEPALRRAGAIIDLHKIAMRPGKPLMAGRIGEMRVLGLPGNPVSAMICAWAFLTPLLKRLLGDLTPDEPPAPAKLAAPLPQNGDRLHFMRAQTAPSPHGGAPRVRPLPDQDSSLMAALARADRLIIRPPFAPALAEGDSVDAIPIDF
ncbi:MAG: molybdopterin molybdotransferase MoeA [Hyphomicrobiales bacterium]|nr:molybdopterin molybdotransferase MoeA [Hyphomicrobiales bacterium]